MAKALELYVPILVDGDVDKAPMQKFGVRGYPTVKFLKADESVIGDMGGKRSVGQLSNLAQGLLKEHRPRLNKAYVKIFKETGQKVRDGL